MQIALAVTVKHAKLDAVIAAAQSNEISFLLFISSLPLSFPAHICRFIIFLNNPEKTNISENNLV